MNQFCEAFLGLTAVCTGMGSLICLIAAIIYVATDESSKEFCLFVLGFILLGCISVASVTATVHYGEHIAASTSQPAEVPQ
jgi:multisubunit Na+/H+ antiporter MnhG subunit